MCKISINKMLWLALMFVIQCVSCNDIYVEEIAVYRYIVAPLLLPFDCQYQWVYSRQEDWGHPQP